MTKKVGNWPVCFITDRRGFSGGERSGKMAGRAAVMCAGAVLALILAYGCSGPVDTYVSWLGDVNPAVRKAASDSLFAMREDPQTVRKVIRVLKSKKRPAVLAALRLLAAIGDTAASGPVAKKFEKSDGAVRMEALMTLGRLGGPTAENAVVKALGDTSAAVRQIAVNALGGMMSLESLDHVKRMRHDPSPGVRAAAVHALGQYSDVFGAGVRAVDFTTAIQDSADVVRWSAVRALRREWRDDGIAQNLLIHMLEEPSEAIRRDVILILAAKRCRMAIPLFKARYASAGPQERATISRALKALTGEDFPPSGKTKKPSPPLRK